MLFSQFTILTMGFSLHDKDFRRFLEERYHLYGPNCPPMYAIMGQKETCSLEVGVYKNKYNVQMVPISEEASFSELTALLLSLYCLVHRIDSTASWKDIDQLLRFRLKGTGRVRVESPVEAPNDKMLAAMRLLAVFVDAVDLDAFNSLCADHAIGFSGAHFRIIGRAAGNRIVASCPAPEPVSQDYAAVAVWLSTKLEGVPVGDNPRYLSTHHKRIFSEHIDTLEALLLRREGWDNLVGNDVNRLKRINEYFRQEGRWMAWTRIAEAALKFTPETSPVFTPLVRTLLWVFFWTRHYDDLQSWMKRYPGADATGESSYAVKLRYMQTDQLPGLIKDMKTNASDDYWRSSLLGRSLARLAVKERDESRRRDQFEEAKHYLKRALEGARAR